MPQIKPIKELRNTTEISELCHSTMEPIFITKNGYGDLVIMSMDVYDSILEASRIDKAIEEAEKEYAANGDLLDAATSLQALRRKHLG